MNVLLVSHAGTLSRYLYITASHLHYTVSPKNVTTFYTIAEVGNKNHLSMTRSDY